MKLRRAATITGLSTLGLILVILILLCLPLGYYGPFGGWGYSPIGLIVVVLLVLALTGRL